MWRQVVRRDSAVQEGLHEHTLDANHLEAGILTPRDRRRLTRSWNDNDFIDLHWRLHCVPPCTAMATSYNLYCTHSIISTPSKHFLPPSATSHQLRVLLHPVAAVNLVRESDRCSSPFPLLTSAIHWRIVTGDCTSSATNRPAFHPHQVAHLHPSNGTGRQSSGCLLGNPGSVCFQADEAATRQHGMNDNRFLVPEKRSTSSTYMEPQVLKGGPRHQVLIAVQAPRNRPSSTRRRSHCP